MKLTTAQEAKEFRAETDTVIAIANEVCEDAKSRMAYLLWMWLHSPENPCRCTKSHAVLFLKRDEKFRIA